MMLLKYKDDFDNFKVIHDKYLENPKANKKEFNEVGSDLLDIVRRYENILCGHSENGGYGKFSSKLADKFWEEVRKNFPKIDEVGIR